MQNNVLFLFTINKVKRTRYVNKMKIKYRTILILMYTYFSDTTFQFATVRTDIRYKCFL